MGTQQARPQGAEEQCHGHTRQRKRCACFAPPRCPQPAAAARALPRRRPCPGAPCTSSRRRPSPAASCATIVRPSRRLQSATAAPVLLLFCSCSVSSPVLHSRFAAGGYGSSITANLEAASGASSALLDTFKSVAPPSSTLSTRQLPKRRRLRFSMPSSLSLKAMHSVSPATSMHMMRRFCG